MNQKAFELGLFDSNFVTPHGLDNQNHYTTPYDLALLTNYALNNSVFKKIVSTKTTTIHFNNSTIEISNTNELLGNLDGVYGVKTGFTFESGRCLVSACKRENLDIIVVVLGADTKSIRTQDSKNLINYIFNNYEYIDISDSVNTAFNTYISYFNQNYKLEKTSTIPKLSLQKLENYNFPLLKNNISNINTKIYTTTNFNSNVSVGNIVGRIDIYCKNTLLCSSNITLENQLIPNNWLFYLKKTLSVYK
jgi:D-alanyl-D-alanine carboxypeptidase (penicillin-binding protein 5/6)